jgi:hypothetical protein
LPARYIPYNTDKLSFSLVVFYCAYALEIVLPRRLYDNKFFRRCQELLPANCEAVKSKLDFRQPHDLIKRDVGS